MLPLVRACSLSGDFTNLYFALGIIALSFPVIFVSNRIYVAPASRESEFLRTRVATWRSLLQKTQFLTAHGIAVEIACQILAIKTEHLQRFRAKPES